MENPLVNQQLEKDLGNIGLFLSGGGYRAAAFHLGSVRIQVWERGMREGIVKSQEWAEIA